MSSVNQDAIRHSMFAYVGSGLSVIPVDTKTKLAVCPDWSQYVTRVPTGDEIDAWTLKYPDAGVAVVCGCISGHLEAMDFDRLRSYEEWLYELGPQGDLRSRLVFESTPRGFHVYYKCFERPSGSRILSRRLGVELRAKGQYTICAPTAGYAPIRSDLAGVQTITAEQRQLLFEAVDKIDRSDRVSSK